MSLAKAGKRRNIPTFEDAGNVNTNIDTNNETEVEVKSETEETPDVEVKSEVVEGIDVPVSAIVDTVVKKPKEKPKRQISIYLDEDVAKAFEKFGKKHGKGAKSDLINKFLRTALNVKNETSGE